MCLLFLGIRFGAEPSIAFPPRLNMLLFRSAPFTTRVFCGHDM